MLSKHHPMLMLAHPIKCLLHALMKDNAADDVHRSFGGAGTKAHNRQRTGDSFEVHEDGPKGRQQGLVRNAQGAAGGKKAKPRAVVLSQSTSICCIKLPYIRCHRALA